MSSFALSDYAYMDAPSCHTRDVSVICHECKQVFDVPLGPNEEFGDLREDERPACCDSPDFEVMR